ncbi:MAG: NAD-binding protein [Myxococcales bacterium]|nr:NAD-binding protein [Myxococcales bacterium]
MTTEGHSQRRRIRARLLFRQNRAALFVVLAWFLANYLIFAVLMSKGWTRALWTLFYFEPDQSKWGNFYMTMSDFVVFGMVVSVVATGVSRHYRPEQTCSILASLAKDHVVVVGYTNLGQRVVELCEQRGIPVVVIDDDPERVASLIQGERPLVIGSGADSGALAAASVGKAKLVVIAEDGVELGAVAARRVRNIAPKVSLVVRCSDDDVGQVLARAYDAKIISTTKLAAKHVEQTAIKQGVRRCVIIGFNSLAVRVYAALRPKGVEVTIIDDKREKRPTGGHDGALDGIQSAVSVGDPSSYEVLRAAGAHEAELVVLTGEDLGHALVVSERVRDLNGQTRLIVRAFHEDAAAILTQAPFRAEVVSSSRFAIRALVREGAFESVGVERNTSA